MVTVMSLWIPILVSAVSVFIVSSIIHVALPYHHTDFGKLPAEAEIMDALRDFDIPPGDYEMPKATTAAEGKSAEYQERWKQGPVAQITVLPTTPPPIGKRLGVWFLYLVVVAGFAAYLAGAALAPGAPFGAVFRLVGCAAFGGYALALVQTSIWYNRAWGTTGKLLFDGLIYALVTAAIFGWRWPDE